MLELGDIGNPADPLWNIMKEQLLEMIKELVADFIPGGTLVTIGPELFDNLQGGNWMDAMFNAVDIVLNEADAVFPAAKVASFGAGLFVTGKQLKKVYKAFNKAKGVGEEFLLKFYNVFRNRLNWGVSTIRQNFKFLGGKNTKIENMNGEEFFNKLKDEFGITGNGFPGKNGAPVFELRQIQLINYTFYLVLFPSKKP